MNRADLQLSALRRELTRRQRSRRLMTGRRTPLSKMARLRRPTPPADPKSVLHRLHGLREAGDSLLAQTQAMHVPGPSPHTGISTGAVPSDKAELAPPSSSNCRLQGSVATTTSQGLPFRSSCTSSAAVASPYSRNPAPGARRGGSSAGITTPQPCLSTPSLVGLRDQEHKDTGGGFLTHFADPRDLCTPSHGGGGAAAGGLRGVGDTAAGGSTTPLSMLRSIHRLQQLQRLQREGAQLVAAIDASEAAVLGA
ncbi:hypothetical protein Vretimale_16486 [Volvox reticuliferus]|uniref:Uncharacterized protein n=1 Tax=Volvox reticuliferus TaxID=1737510 RepID=A0A8J4GU88_9CHLO|nr:hypothetical protein Vretifemale_17582 [Volvox reticuliferus]GIM13433.1 hypothetical protein Vretimale_16486 [Volvox reticuliferus]